MSTPSLFNVPAGKRAPRVAGGKQVSPTPVPQPVPEQVDPAAPAQVVTASSLAPLRIEDVKKAVPANLRGSITQSVVDTLNTISNDPIVAENIRENFVGYSAVMKEGRFKTEDYIHAVAYVSFKLMGHSNEDAYARAFPQRYANLVAKGIPRKDIASYVSSYHKGKLVNLIMEQSLVPTWVLNQDLFQKALNVQADLMLNANSEKVRTDAANSLLTHLKKPEAKGDFQINLNQTDSSGMSEMKAMLGQLAQTQRDMIEGGHMKTIEVAASKLINKEDVIDVID